MAQDKPLVKMDVYGDFRTPLPVATFCRGHRFCPEAVALSRALRDEDSAAETLRLAENALEAAREYRRNCVAAATKRMDDTNGV